MVDGGKEKERITNMPTILIIDDSEKDQQLLHEILSQLGYNIIKAYNGKQGLDKIKQQQPDLILLDLIMPEIDGFEVLKILKSDESTRLIPVVIISSFSEIEYNKNVIDLGADDFITKPFNPLLVNMRLKSLLRTKNLVDKLDNSERVLFALANAIEARDEYTEGHISRVTDMVVKLGKIMSFPDEQVEILRKGAILHDIGKIGIADSILKKPGKLSPEEFEIMKQHTIIGEKICAPLKSLQNLLGMVRSHHERLDGTGYPDGLKDSDISMSTRILTVVDIFDSLVSEKPYREKMSVQNAVNILKEEAEKGWLDKEVVNLFIKNVVRV